jgi:hypothetical protein
MPIYRFEEWDFVPFQIFNGLNFYRSRNENNENFHNKIFWELDKEMLDIHLENQKIIKNNIIEINPDDSLTDALMKYDEHVTIYTPSHI